MYGQFCYEVPRHERLRMLSRRSFLRTATGVSSTVVLSQVCRRISCSFKDSNRKVYLTVIFSATCFSAVLLCSKTHVHGNDVLESPELPGYVIEHWKREFAVLESEIQEKRRLYEAGKDPYETDRILDRQSCILPGDRTPFSVEYRRTRCAHQENDRGFWSRIVCSARA